MGSLEAPFFMLDETKLKIFKSFLSWDECKKFLKAVPAVTSEKMSWEDRTVSILNWEITDRVTNYVNSYFNTTLQCYDSQIQLWPIGSYSMPHKHDEDGREIGAWNAMIYLNHNYEGGHFVYPGGNFKPAAGTLTFFNGGKMYHGVTDVSKHHRYTMIFWFKQNGENNV